MAYQDLEQASGRLMVIDRHYWLGPARELPVAGLEAAAEKAALSIVTIPPTAGPSPPSPSKRINVEQALIDSMLSGTRRDEVPAEPAVSELMMRATSTGIESEATYGSGWLVQGA